MSNTQELYYRADQQLEEVEELIQNLTSQNHESLDSQEADEAERVVGEKLRAVGTAQRQKHCLTQLKEQSEKLQRQTKELEANTASIKSNDGKYDFAKWRKIIDEFDQERFDNLLPIVMGKESSGTLDRFRNISKSHKQALMNLEKQVVEEKLQIEVQNVEKANNKIRELEGKLNATGSKIIELNKSMKEKEAENKDKDAENKEKDVEIQKLKALQEKLKTAELKISELDKSLDEKETELRAAHQEAEASRDTINKAASRMSVLESSVNEKDAEVKKLGEEKDAEMKKLRQEKDEEMKRLCQEKDKELQKIKDQTINRVENIRKEKDTEIETAKTAYRDEINAVETKIQDLRSEVSQWELKELGIAKYLMEQSGLVRDTKSWIPFVKVMNSCAHLRMQQLSEEHEHPWTILQAWDVRKVPLVNLQDGDLTTHTIQLHGRILGRLWDDDTIALIRVLVLQIRDARSAPVDILRYLLENCLESLRHEDTPTGAGALRNNRSHLVAFSCWQCADLMHRRLPEVEEISRVAHSFRNLVANGWQGLASFVSLLGDDYGVELKMLIRSRRALDAGQQPPNNTPVSSILFDKPVQYSHVRISAS